MHVTTIHLQPCNEPVHVDYNLSTRLCLTGNYSTVSSQPIHSYQQPHNKVNSLLTTYTKLPTIVQQGQQSAHNLRIHSYQQPHNKVNSQLTTYTQLPTTSQQGQQSAHNLYTVTNNLTTSSTVCSQATYTQLPTTSQQGQQSVHNLRIHSYQQSHNKVVTCM